MNPMMGTLANAKMAGLLPQIGRLKQLMQGNPAALLSGNPQYAKAMQLVQQSGGDARAAFYGLAQQMGVDPEQILSALK